MYIVLVVILVALVGVMLGRRHLGGAATPAMAGLAMLAIVVVVATNLFTGSEAKTSNRLETTFEKACGFMIGQRVASDVPGGGTVLLIQHVPAYLGAAVCEAQAEGLRDGLGTGDWSVRVASVDVADVEKDAGINPAMFDTARFSSLLGEHAEAAAVVSLIGFPQGKPNQVKGKMPALYVLEDWAGTSASWKRNPALKAIVTPKPGSGRPGAVNLDSPLPELFQLRYQMSP